MLTKSVALVVPPLAAPAAWDARLRIWAALRTPEARLDRSAPRGGMQRCRSTPRSETDYSFYDGHLEPKLRLSRRARRSGAVWRKLAQLVLPCRLHRDHVLLQLRQRLGELLALFRSAQ